MRIMVLDDQATWAQLLQYLAPQHAFEPVGYPELGSALSEPWDIALVDVQLAPWMSDGTQPTGLDALEDIARLRPQLPCFLHSSSDEENRRLFHYAAFWLHVDHRQALPGGPARLLGALSKPSDLNALQSCLAAAQRDTLLHTSAHTYVGSNILPNLLRNQYDLRVWRAPADGHTTGPVLARIAGCSPQGAANIVKRLAAFLSRSGLSDRPLDAWDQTMTSSVSRLATFAVLHRPFFYSPQAECINDAIVSDR